MRGQMSDAVRLLGKSCCKKECFGDAGVSEALFFMSIRLVGLNGFRQHIRIKLRAVALEMDAVRIEEIFFSFACRIPID